VETLRYIDLAVLVGYLLVTVGLGCAFALRRRNTDEFMAGGRSLPGWAVGLSMYGSYVSSISFLGNPGKSFAADWNFFVFSLATPVAAVIAVQWFVPFYRRGGEVSAYEHLGRRFGPWAGTYAVVCFLLTQTARTGSVLYLLALAVSPLTGWGVPAIILMTGTLMILYTIFGGIQAAVWIGALQSLVLIAGPIVCVVVLMANVPGGFAGVIDHASAAGKFSLGSWSPALDRPTYWVVLIYGLTMNLGNFGIDQSYVQRYITTPTVREAKRSVWITTALYVPTAALFFFIGTALWVLHRTRPELFPPGLDAAAKPDTVFPAFIAHQLPAGLAGLVVAAIFAASMDSNLSSMATLTLCDVYKRHLRPHAGERESMRVLHGATLFWGVVATGAALAMTRVKNVLDVWWELAGIFSGGMLGLFLLGLIARRARCAAGATAVAVGVLVILWMTFSRAPWWPASLDALRSPFDKLMITVIGTLAVLLVGLAVSRFGRGKPDPASPTVTPEPRGFDVAWTGTGRE
jgi:SSS family solute:Na+ symporter